MKFRILNVRSFFLLAVSAVTLSACDRLPWEGPADTLIKTEVEPAPTAPIETPPERSMLNWTWSEAEGVLWSFGSAQPEVYWPSGGGIGIRTPSDATDVDVFVRSPKMKIEGAEFTKIVVDLECAVPGKQDDLTIYYITESHSESPSFRATPIDSSPLQAGDRRKLQYDMTRLARGEGDWVGSSIQRIRFDLPQGAGADYILHSIQVCNPDDPSCL